MLVRILQPHDPRSADAERALNLLPRKTQIQIVLQNLYELWVVATPPVPQNGLGLTTSAAQLELARLKSIFEFLPDTPWVFSIWEDLVVGYNVSGKPAHDARLVARCSGIGLLIRPCVFCKPSIWRRVAAIEASKIVLTTKSIDDEIHVRRLAT